MFTTKKWMTFVLCLLSSTVFAENKQVEVDQKVKDYITAIMLEKAEILKKEGKDFSFDHVKIGFMSLQDDSGVVNAAVYKFGKRYCCLGLSRLFVTLVKEWVLNKENNNVFLFYPYGDYKIEANISKRRLEKMLRALIDHELGHIFYKDHCRQYRPFVLGKFYASLAIGIGSWLWWRSLAVDDSYKIVKKICAGGTIAALCYNYCTSQMYETLNWTSVAAYKWQEQEADDFITSDIELLKAAVLFHEIDLKTHEYIYCDTKSIQFFALCKRMSSVEYTKKYPMFAHRLMEPWKLCHAVHPVPQKRIDRFKERIEELKVQGYKDVQVDPATITVYKGDQIIEQVTV